MARICITPTRTGTWEVGLGTSWHFMAAFSCSSAVELDRDVTWGIANPFRSIKIEEYNSSHYCTLGKQWVAAGSYYPRHPRDFTLSIISYESAA